MVVNESSVHTRRTVTHFNYDHRERENIRLFGVRSTLFQDFWRSPSCGIAEIKGGARRVIRVLGDRSKTKVRDLRTAGLV